MTRLVALLLAPLVMLAAPALAQQGDCRNQAHTVDRELTLMNPQLAPTERYRAERDLAYAQGLCDFDPTRGSWELDKLRRETQLAQQPRFIAPPRDRWNPGGIDDLN